MNGNSAGVVHEGPDRREAGLLADVQKVWNPVFVRVVENQPAAAWDTISPSQNTYLLIGGAVYAVCQKIFFREPFGLINPAFRVECIAILVESIPLDPMKDVPTEIDVERIAVGAEQADQTIQTQSKLL